MPESFDYIVIGSGSAGSVISARLTEDRSTRVLVLEAGGTDDKFFYQRPGGLALVYQVPQLKKAADWGYKTEPLQGLDNRKMPYTRGKIVGGCSTVNGMLYVRGHKDNYDQWVERGCEGWSWDELLPLFKRSEGHEDGNTEAHGGDGPLKVTRQQGVSPVSEAWVEAASAVTGAPQVDDFNGGDNEGIGMYQQTCSQRRRSSAAVAFLHPALADRTNLELRMGCLVHKLLIEDGKCIGVRYETADGQLHDVMASKEVILCAGAIGSPQILLLSGIGPAEHLQQMGIDLVLDLPGVGENLHDHLFVPLRFNATADTGHTSTSPHFLWGMFKDFAWNEGWFGKTFLEGGGFVKSEPDQPRANLQYLTIPWAYPEPNDDTEESLFATITGIGAKGPIATNHSYTVMPILLYPKSRGTVRLKSSDPRQHPAIDPAFLVEDEDMELLLKGVKQTREIAATAPVSQYLLSEAFPGPQCKSDDALRAHIRLAAKTVYHPVGTCKMGIDDMSVVDPQLRLRGIENLRVADASIMPEITGGNTNAPSICIGEKAADMIRGI
jgi:choline dehydrogenase-like flavoprotein